MDYYGFLSGLIALAGIALAKVLSSRQVDKEMDSILADSSKPINPATTSATDHGDGLLREKNKISSPTSFSRRGTVIETLRNMGCQPNWDDDYVYINYRDNNFAIATAEDSYFIQIFFTNWGYVSLDDIDSVTRVRTAINKLNENNTFNIVYTLDEQNWQMNVHTRYTTVWTPGITHKEDYLDILFCDMINTRLHLENTLNELNEAKNA